MSFPIQYKQQQQQQPTTTLINNTKQQQQIDNNMSSSVKKILSTSNINPNILKTSYAVRGKVVIKANQIEHDLKSENHNYPFQDIVYCNIGNPQQLKQKPLTFHRNVLSLLTSSDWLKNEEQKGLLKKLVKEDVVLRAEKMINAIDSHSTGAYTHSQGYEFVREDIAQFIEERDGLKKGTVSIDRIFITDGASPGVQLGLKMLIRNDKDGIMIPIPQYPLYSATIDLCGGSQVPYYLQEETGWSLGIEELERSYEEYSKKGINVRALVIINPGNPTGQVLDKSNMEDIIRFCMKRGVVLLADEVYQENNYTNGKKPFYSFNKIAHDMGVGKEIEMISYHSVSKGFIGECGRRGGYFQLSEGIDASVKDELYKIASVNLCPNADGQLMVDLMVNPPKKGEPSYEQYINERDTILNSLKRRAEKLVSLLNSLEGVSCQPVEGAMYAFPKIELPEKAIKKAKELGLAPDLFYVMELLENTGLTTVPGSGFQQKEGTYHFRTTILPPESQIESVVERMAKFHAKFMQTYK
ncbi:hypothetical protein ABK040_004979 [Willaertia magna]